MKIITERLHCHKEGCKKYIMVKRQDTFDSYYGGTKYGIIDLRNQVVYCDKHRKEQENDK
jgi:hypothetical protein